MAGPPHSLPASPPPGPSNENTHLLRSSYSVSRLPPASANHPIALNKRPPLYSVPSSQSLKSLKSLTNLNDPVIDSYINNKQSRHRAGHDNDNDSMLSALDFSKYTSVPSSSSSSSANHKKFDVKAYVSYYCPILRWLPHYSYQHDFLGDLLAGLSLASFQIPYVMSIAQSLAHLPPVLGLYSIIAGALVYAVLGSVPVLIIGPSPSTALIYGTVIETIRHNYEQFSERDVSAIISVVIGAILMAAGIGRLGFLDNLLSRALLKGFIGAMGLIMIVNELAIEMGMTELAKSQPHATTLDKILFVVNYWRHTHIKTCLVSVVTLSVVLLARSVKGKLVNQYKQRAAIYFPELLLMVVLGTYFSYTYDWNHQGIDIVGDTTTTTVSAPQSINNPFQIDKLSLYKKTFSTAFLCSILGYFDSTTAAKSLGIKYNYSVSSNRELVALGATNLIVSCFGGLPCFGALGRSKINLLSGATTPMSAIIMGLAVAVGIVWLLPTLYYLPECILALSTTIIGITVLEEVPHDLKFYWSIGGFDEIATFVLIFVVTILWSAEAGVTLGIIVAVVRVVKHSSKSRIQILGRIPHTNVFRNADELIEESFNAYLRNEEDDQDDSDQSSENWQNLIAEIEELEGILIIKIPEPLNFANAGDLKNRLTRIEKYGSLLVHPSQPSKRDFNNSNVKTIIFDCKGMDHIDSSATQLLHEIIQRYLETDQMQVCFSRLPINPKLRDKFRKSGIIKLVNDNFEGDHSETNSVGIPTAVSNLGPGFFLSIEDALNSIDINDV